MSHHALRISDVIAALKRICTSLRVISCDRCAAGEAHAGANGGPRADIAAQATQSRTCGRADECTSGGGCHRIILRGRSGLLRIRHLGLSIVTAGGVICLELVEAFALARHGHHGGAGWRRHGARTQRQ